MLRKRGVDVIALDDTPLDGAKTNGSQAVALKFTSLNFKLDFDYNENPPPWFGVQQGSWDNVADHPNRTLLLCWPPPERPAIEAEKGGTVVNLLGARCVANYKGDTIVYVGDWRGASSVTGGAAMQEQLSHSFALTKTISIPNWPGDIDTLTVWKRKPGPLSLPPTLPPPDADAREFRKSRVVKSPLPTAEETKIRKELVRVARLMWLSTIVAENLVPRMQKGQPITPGEATIVEEFRQEQSAAAEREAREAKEKSKERGAEM
mmetsp:Transcript_12437/g.26632  ORF Transcript_12437/g.26632 Transcript_12437/m.26632 type:complete len:263 (-) Transcript_12437:32-820(-)